MQIPFSVIFNLSQGLESAMIESLIILRDVILAALLSWIGVDYVETSAEPINAADIRIEFSEVDQLPIRLILESKTSKSTFGCEEQLFQS
ncbi:MAG: hypothetical protein CMK09_03290 [Ponticaulis sp.]|nr:hypothetical protein [Ponticaulis sp.]